MWRRGCLCSPPMKSNLTARKLANTPILLSHARAPTWIIIGLVAALQAGCAAHDESPVADLAAGERAASPAAVASRPTVADPTASAIMQDDVAQMLSARAEVWNQLAGNLPDGYVLSIEMIHSQPDQPFAVYTVVEGHHVVQSVVGHAPSAAELIATGPASAEAIALGEPPPKQPPELGIIAQGTSLMNAAFGQGAQSAAGTGSTAQAGTQRVVRAPAGGARTASVSKELLDRVVTARWQAWTARANKLPDGYVLSVSLLHSQANQAFAVYIVVKNHLPIQHVVGDSPDVGADAPASPNIFALGEPPPKQDPPPGIIAQGNSLLSTAFATP